MNLQKPFSFSLSTPNTTATPAATTGGGLFGNSNSTATTQPQSGLFSGFGTPAANTSTAGTGLSGSTSFGSGFGLNKPTSTVSPFGATSTTTTNAATSSPFNFGKPATTTSSPFSLGGTTTGTTGTTTASPFGSFGQTSTTTQPTTSAFSGFGSSLTGQKQTTSIFGQTQTATSTTQSSLFSAQPNQTFGASNTNPLNLTQNQNSLNQTQQQASPDIDQLMGALVNPQIFNDERDLIIAKWNQLQAFYGNGKIFFQNSSIDVSKDNRLTKFKTIGYSCKPSNKNEDGLVCLVMNQKEQLVKTNQKNITDCLHKIFNSDQALSIQIETIKPTPEDKTEVVFYVKQRVSPLTDQTNRVPSTLVYQHLSKQEVTNSLISGLKTNPTIKQQLEQINVVDVYPLVGLTDEQIKTYLETIPNGINPVLWEQAKKNNPNQKKLMPVQINGFQEINKRFKLQDQENQSHKESLAAINNSIESLNSRNKILKSKIEQFRARNEDLEQRMLRVMINYEIRRKIGFPLQDNEKYLLNILDSFHIELNSPINKEIHSQKLNEFMEIIKSIESSNRNTVSGAKLPTQETIDLNNLGEVQNSLREQHKAFKSLIDIINTDLKDLNTIKKSLYNEK